MNTHRRERHGERLLISEVLHQVGKTANGLEPLYSRQVFERLRETLDDIVGPNYEILDDGLWLRPNDFVDDVNWTPICDLDEGPTSPDPLTSPALPFPFTARQLAAFMLDGWGWHLHQQFAAEDGQVDPKPLMMLLGGVRDVKPREALVEAFAALARARRQVGPPDPNLAESRQAAAAAYEEAMEEANRIHDWREDGIGEHERSARVQRRNEMTAAAKAAFHNARRAAERADVDDRKAMVRCLLSPAKGKMSREEWDALTADRKATAWMAGREPDLTPDEERQHLVGWCDATVRADYWFGLASIAASEAAQLLSCENPLSARADWLEVASEHMSPEARRELLRGFEDAGGTRPLLEWLQCARDRGWRYDPWVDQYVTARGESLQRPAGDAGESPEERRQRLRARKAALKASGAKAFLKLMASEEGVTTSRLKQLIGPTEPEGATWAGPLVRASAVARASPKKTTRQR